MKELHVKGVMVKAKNKQKENRMNDNTLEVISCTLFILWLLVCAIQDIKDKKLSVFLIFLGFTCLFPFSFLSNTISIYNRLGGLLLGLFLVAMTYVTRGQIGIGDGLFVMVVGICFGFGISGTMLIYGLVLSALISLYLILLKKGNRDTRIPFIPFLFLGYLGILLL